VVCNSYDAGTVGHVLKKLYPDTPPNQLPQPYWYPNTISDTYMIYTYVAQYMPIEGSLCSNSSSRI
jgi:hypothetical protein